MVIYSVHDVTQEEEGGQARTVPPEAAFRTVPRDYTTFLIWRVTVSLLSTIKLMIIIIKTCRFDY